MNNSMNEIVKWATDLQAYMPYIASVVCALISGFTSYFVSRKQVKSDMAKIEKQFTLDLEKERELFKMEKEKMEIEHKYQLELKQKDLDNALGNSLISSMITEAMKNPEIKKQFQNGLSSGIRQKGKK